MAKNHSVLGNRLQGAKVRRDRALKAFTKAQKKLEREQVELQSIVDDIDVEIAKLREIKDDAVEHANRNDRTLVKLLDLFR